MRKCKSNKLRTFYNSNRGLVSRRGCSSSNGKGEEKDRTWEEKDMRRRNTEERSRAEAEERHLFTLPCILNSMVNFTERTDMTSTDMTNNWIVKLTELPF